MSIPDQIEVWSHDRAEPRLAGTLRPSFMGRVLAGASLEYDLAFIEDGYPLSPELPLRRGRIFTPENTTMFGVLQEPVCPHVSSASSTFSSASPI